MSDKLKALAARIGGTYITASSEADAATAITKHPKEGSIQWIMSYIERNTGFGPKHLSYDKQMGGYRIMNAAESRDISPRMPLKRLMEWASAFVKGYDAAKGRL